MSSEGTENQTLSLRSGWRYAIVNSAFAPHPFELIEELMSPPDDDVVQLSQEDPGALEDDTSVAWMETMGEPEIYFTVSPSFMAAVNAYRCGVHVSTMRGMVTYME